MMETNILNKSKLKNGYKMSLPYLIFFIVISIVFIFGTTLRKNQLSKLEKRHRFTIATTIKSFKSGKSSRKIQYLFYYTNTEYVNSCGYNEQIKRSQGRYYVMFDPLDPGNAELLKIPANDSITKAPTEGWGWIPGYSNYGAAELLKMKP